MSSLEEEILVQMVEDFIESESSSPIFSASSKCLPLIHHTQYLTLQVCFFHMHDDASKGQTQRVFHS